MPDDNDGKFENYLKSFRPCDPEPLPHRATKDGGPSRVALAFTAVSCMVLAALLLVALWRPDRLATDSPLSEARTNVSENRVTAPILTRIAFDDHDAFAEMLARKAEAQFPPMKGEQSTLRVLAKE